MSDQKRRVVTFHKPEGIVTLALYLGIGFAFHWLVIGSKIDYTDAASIAVILAWPLAFFYYFFKYVLITLVVVGVGLFVIWQLAGAYERRENRKRHDAAIKAREERDAKRAAQRIDHPGF